MRWRRTSVTLIAEFAGMARGTARPHRLPRRSPMPMAREKVRRGVRRGRGKPGDVAARQRDCADQWHVTGRAGGIGRGEVHRLDPVTGEAALHDRLAHRHALLARLRMTSGAGRRLPRRLLRRLRCVLRMIELEIRPARVLGRTPRDDFLDRAVVACGARNRIRPQRRALLRRTRVTGDAGRKQRFVLQVIEPLRRLLHQSEQTQRDDHRSALPPGMRRIAGGRCPRSPPLPNASTARSVTRHCPQSIAAASGRFRFSA